MFSMLRSVASEAPTLSPVFKMCTSLMISIVPWRSKKEKHKTQKNYFVHWIKFNFKNQKVWYSLSSKILSSRTDDHHLKSLKPRTHLVPEAKLRSLPWKSWWGWKEPGRRKSSQGQDRCSGLEWRRGMEQWLHYEQELAPCFPQACPWPRPGLHEWTRSQHCHGWKAAA